MLYAYCQSAEGLRAVAGLDLAAQQKSLVWVDLCEPTAEEQGMVNHLFSTDIPTREEMAEIELSSRLYQENSAVYATATLVTKADTEAPESNVVTFVLSGDCLITVRYTDPQPFRNFVNRAERSNNGITNGAAVGAGLLEAIVDRMADILERVAQDLDQVARVVFRSPLLRNSDQSLDFAALLQRIGNSGDVVSKARESFVSISRVLSFLAQSSFYRVGSEDQTRLHTLLRDVAALSDHATFLANKVNFLLDATLGMISIEQNKIIKIFSVAAVVFLPPTLVASIYGMNFHAMPELNLVFGYPLALLFMVLSAYMPYKFFKRKGWL
jgi:magnesium transporter